MRKLCKLFSSPEAVWDTSASAETSGSIKGSAPDVTGLKSRRPKHCSTLASSLYFVCYVSTSKRGISSTELSRKLLRKKACWTFRKKAIKIHHRKKLLIDRKMNVDETYVGEQDEKSMEHNEGKMVVAVVEQKGKCFSWIYGRTGETVNRAHLKRFKINRIAPDGALRNDQWNYYRGLEAEFPKPVQKKPKMTKKNIPQAPWTIILLKASLRDEHHLVLHLQLYIDLHLPL